MAFGTRRLMRNLLIPNTRKWELLKEIDPALEVVEKDYAPHGGSVFTLQGSALSFADQEGNVLVDDNGWRISLNDASFNARSREKLVEKAFAMCVQADGLGVRGFMPDPVAFISARRPDGTTEYFQFEPEIVKFTKWPNVIVKLAH